MVNFKTGNRGERRIYFLPSLTQKKGKMKSRWFTTRVFAFILFAPKNNIFFFQAAREKQHQMNG